MRLIADQHNEKYDHRCCLIYYSSFLFSSILCRKAVTTHTHTHTHTHTYKHTLCNQGRYALDNVVLIILELHKYILCPRLLLLPTALDCTKNCLEREKKKIIKKIKARYRDSPVRKRGSTVVLCGAINKPWCLFILIMILIKKEN